MRDAWIVWLADQLGVSISQVEGALSAAADKLDEVLTDDPLPVEVIEWLRGSA